MLRFFILIICCVFNPINAQSLLNNKEVLFTRQDSLRGSITKERSWWDLKQYRLDIKVNPLDSTITGFNVIKYKVLQEYNVMQIDLQNPLAISKIIQDGIELKYNREGNVYFVNLKSPQKIGTTNELTVFYGGKPKVAVNPPWDGGISWKKDSNGELLLFRQIVNHD
jgi:hypothetical protein